MIRFSVLQARTQELVAVGALAIVAIVLAATGPGIVHLYGTTVATCGVHRDCATATAAFTATDGPLQVIVDFLVLAVPALVGMFWGAPTVAREFETGTFRLAWTQGVTRTRWIATKFGLGVGASMLAGGLVSLMATWWSSLFDRVNPEIFNPLIYASRGLAPVGYAAFAFALGFTAGAVIRLLLPAILLALAGFVGVRALVQELIRPHLFAPLHRAFAITDVPLVGFDLNSGTARVMTTTKGIMSSAWVLSNQVVDPAGRAPTSRFLTRACSFNATTGAFNPKSCVAHLVAARFHELVAFIPTSRYWPMQWYETGMFVALALILGVTCILWIRRPIS
jgi:hypothetical protein